MALSADAPSKKPIVGTFEDYPQKASTTIYEGAAADGMNEAGLVANLLYLAEAE